MTSKTIKKPLWDIYFHALGACSQDTRSTRFTRQVFQKCERELASILQHVEDTGIRSIDLANKLSISKQAANQMVKEIEKRGYLQRVPDPEDKRAQRISLTDQGWQAWVVGLKAMQAMEQQLESALGEQTLQEMRIQAAEVERILAA